MVYYWLIAGVFMLVVQIALGGITRLTGSGLSITQWDVITGALPPVTEEGWFKEFHKYQQTPQYRLLNTHFELIDFKRIFFWEWFHRLWARLMGMVFAVGFIYFLVRGYFTRRMILPLVVLFALGALQGLVGWIMVASGLTGDAIYVKPTRLALHFIFALGLLCYTFWFALQLGIDQTQRINTPSLRKYLAFILALLCLQLFYGALMAGHKAASIAPTWPSINGYYFRLPGLFDRTKGWIQLIDHTLTVHFIHRNLAYILWMALGWLGILAQGKTGLIKRMAWWPLAIATAQVMLGIFTLLSARQILPNHWGKFEWLAQMHQLVGMALLLSVVALLFASTGPKNNELGCKD